MPEINHKSVTAILLLLMVVALFTGSGLTPQAASDDVVMEYYLENVASVFSRDYLFETEKSFACQVRSIYRRTDYRGELNSIDTALFGLYGHHGKIDSITIVDSAAVGNNRFPGKLGLVRVWEAENSYYFFPNDTGAGRLAIGYEPVDSEAENPPSGFFNIDRYNFDLLALFVYFPDPPDNERLSRTFSFDRVDSVIVPRKLEIHATKMRFLGREYINHILEFFDYHIN